jgi:hypothetical protein
MILHYYTILLMAICSRCFYCIIQSMQYVHARAVDVMAKIDDASYIITNRCVGMLLFCTFVFTYTFTVAE